MHRKLWKHVNTERGQSLVEYAYLLLFVALAAFVGLQSLGISVRNLFETISLP